MKYFILTVSTFLLIASSSFAETETATPLAERKSAKQNQSTAKKDQYIFAGLYAGIGFSVPIGDLAGSGEQKTDAGFASSFGITGGYQFMNWAGALLKVDYTEKELIFNRDNTGQKEITIITTQNVDIAVGYHGFWSYLYWETGFYCGIPVGTWRKEVSLDGAVTSSHLGDAADPGEALFQAGWYIETGVRIEATEKILLLFGLNLEVPFIEAYSNTTDKDKLAPLSGIFNFSVLYRI